ncbi:hypothetical protein ACGFNP_07055 [Nonomuraea sp. NPDC049269]|uniref:hypothetical protein n=1 Tax=Nonomuraea sp. NPDC049269 TaxID=3364349 RepID=UPI0037178791
MLNGLCDLVDAVLGCHIECLSCPMGDELGHTLATSTPVASNRFTRRMQAEVIGGAFPPLNVRMRELSIIA